ncbi:hypothetical protein ALC62_11654 [Cyphomyrmex costatus]|uniref:Ig-like domain-containing protein n=1 Tax=Cyphomyrmex costatus TaxID=456900 RepID=A0A151IC62_9HYME|nr:hypothetical protein ALC62_11654 [Cyphomyrmex costatus]
MPYGGSGKNSDTYNQNALEEAARSGPYFDKSASKNVTALLGKTTYLNCRVKNLGNKTMTLQVSWVRHRDVHLLTIGRYTYTNDQRFRAIHNAHSDDWTLQIKYPQHRDSGIYECQVSTTPHMSHLVHLNVIGNVELRQNVIYRRKRESTSIHCLERTCAARFAIQGTVNWEVIGKDAPERFPLETGAAKLKRALPELYQSFVISTCRVLRRKARDNQLFLPSGDIFCRSTFSNEPKTEILGAPELFINRGSTINLTCVVLQSPEPPAYIFWNHNDAIISYDSSRGGVSVVTEKGDSTTSFLLVQEAKPSDSGRYTCNPSNAQPKSITVHVLNGE